MAIDLRSINAMDLQGMKEKELNAMALEIAQIKEMFLESWERAAKIVQKAIELAQINEYEERHADPKYSTKLQGSTPDFVLKNRREKLEKAKAAEEEIASIKTSDETLVDFINNEETKDDFLGLIEEVQGIEASAEDKQFFEDMGTPVEPVKPVKK